MLSVIIPSFKDPLLHKTIDSILENFTGEFEIIPVLDGYWTTVKDDPRINVLHLGKNVGMRDAINAGVSVAKGEYIMRTDEHCMFDKGFDEKMTKFCEPNWIMTATRYFLDPVKWEKMDLKPVEYEKLVVQSVGDARKFSGYPMPRKGTNRVYPTQAMQGSCWVMPKKWWETIGDLQSEGYGPHLQDSHEMVFKTWKAGGRLMVNSDTWFAHKHVSFPRVHSYGGKEAQDAVAYSYNTWKDYYQEIKKDLDAINSNSN